MNKNYKSNLKLTNYFFMISCVLITFIFSVSISSISKELQKYKVNNPKYNKQIKFAANSEILIDDLFRLLGNDDVSVTLKKYRNDNMIVETVLSTKGIFYEEDMVSGNFFSDENFLSSENLAVFSTTFNGEKSLDILENNNEIKNIKLKEVGVSYSREPKVTVPINLFTQFIGNQDLSLNETIVILSGKEDQIQSAINKIEKNLLNNGKVTINDYFTYDTSIEWRGLISSSILMVFIAILNTIGISYFLVKDETKKIMVKKVVGASNKDILGEFFGYFINIAMKAFVISMIIQLVLSVINKGYIAGVSIKISCFSLISAFLFIILFSLVSMIPFLFYILKINPVMITREG